MSDWVTVYSTGQAYKAEMAKHFLADKGIEAVVMNKKDSMYTTFGDVEVMVKNEQVIKAKMLIKEFEG